MRAFLEGIAAVFVLLGWLVALSLLPELYQAVHG